MGFLSFHRFLPRLTAAVLLAAACLGIAAQNADSTALFQQIGGIAADLGSITGFREKKPVACDMIDRSRLKRFMENRIEEEVKPEEIRAEETTLKKFGFLPRDYDLRASTVELLAEQAAAFYDFKKKKLFVLDASSDALQQTALVHELAHALADQQFNLGGFIKHSGPSDDASTARMAVIEGQASWLMAEYAARKAGQSLKDNPTLLQMMANADGGSGQFPVFDKAPPYIRETLLFPYTKGMLFQQAVFERMDRAAFAEVFRRPPETTQQILHPALYFERKKPTSPPLPEPPPAARHWHELAGGTVGELDHAILMRQYADKEKAAVLAPKWAGGRYRVIEQSKGGPTVLQYSSDWESPGDARGFFEVYKAVLRGKWKTVTVTSDEPDRFAGQGDGEPFLLRVDGSRVSSVEGPVPQT